MLSSPASYAYCLSHWPSLSVCFLCKLTDLSLKLEFHVVFPASYAYCLSLWPSLSVCFLCKLTDLSLKLESLTNQEVSPACTSSAQVIRNAFVEHYYHILHQSPNLVYKFYQDSSCLSWPDMYGKMTTVPTIQAINEKVLSLNYEDYTAEIKTADAQDSFEEGIIVLVTGCLTGKENVRKKFAQTFFLASQDNGYFVLNDVFTYVEEKELQKPVPVNCISEQTSISALTPEPELTHDHHEKTH